MTPPDDHDITEILGRVESEEHRAADQLFALVYDELRRMAGGLMVRERSEHTLQPTALVHEAYVRLLGAREASWQNRAHFFGTAAEAMRRILVEHARRRTSLKRGGDRVRVEMPDLPAEDAQMEELLALDDALHRLESIDADMARVVKLRYFGGLGLSETAEALEISERSVSRAWTSARAWLARELLGPRGSAPEPS